MKAAPLPYSGEPRGVGVIRQSFGAGGSFGAGCALSTYIGLRGEPQQVDVGYGEQDRLVPSAAQRSMKRCSLR